MCVCVCGERDRERTLSIYSLSKFQVYNTILLTVVTMLSIRSSGLIHLMTESLCTLTIISPFFPIPKPLQLPFHYLFLRVWLL